MRKLIASTDAIIDMGMVIIIGVAFAALMVIAYIIWTVYNQLLLADPGTAATSAQNTSYWAQNASRASMNNVTGGFDDAVSLILVAITIFILAIAIGALLMLRGR